MRCPVCVVLTVVAGVMLLIYADSYADSYD